ncbi:MAG: hypothetical protein WDN75_12650 [Bacteroidota bacterium]
MLYSIDQSKSTAVTDGLSDASGPIFDTTGKYLLFLASTNAGPVVNWFDQSNNDMRSTNSIYLLTLQKETLSPFAKESDEEEVKAEKAEPAKTDDKAKKDSAAPEKKSEALRVDWDGIQNRIIDLPIKAGNYSALGMGKDGELLYISTREDGTNVLRKYDIKKRKDTEVMELDQYELSADGKKMLYVSGGNKVWGISNAGEKPEAGKGILNVADIQVKIDPAAEWPNIFNESWRVNRDYFYDPGMHGADWPAMKKKYAVFLPDLACRSDLNNLITWMCSELAVGHHRLTALGEKLNNPQTVPGGLLGADYIVANNRYPDQKDLWRFEFQSESSLTADRTRCECQCWRLHPCCKR